MFEIGFGELVLVMIVGLIVLGPTRLPVAVKTVVGWVRALRTLASSVQHELSQELKLQELQDDLKTVGKIKLEELSPELNKSIKELQSTTEAIKKSYQLDEINVIEQNIPNTVSQQQTSARTKAAVEIIQQKTIGLNNSIKPTKSGSDN